MLCHQQYYSHSQLASARAKFRVGFKSCFGEKKLLKKLLNRNWLRQNEFDVERKTPVDFNNRKTLNLNVDSYTKETLNAYNVTGFEENQEYTGETTPASLGSISKSSHEQRLSIAT